MAAAMADEGDLRGCGIPQSRLRRASSLSQGSLMMRNSSPPCERGEGRKAAGGFRAAGDSGPYEIYRNPV